MQSAVFRAPVGLRGIKLPLPFVLGQGYCAYGAYDAPNEGDNLCRPLNSLPHSLLLSLWQVAWTMILSAASQVRRLALLWQTPPATTVQPALSLVAWLVCSATTQASVTNQNTRPTDWVGPFNTLLNPCRLTACGGFVVRRKGPHIHV